ncbi:hypothetical protein HK104_010066 [Borealophlyctis nickersoniae]|nr:hypothetical protein HK104_010066 [Borealophlyctis nickersoniae]
MTQTGIWVRRLYMGVVAFDILWMSGADLAFVANYAMAVGYNLESTSFQVDTASIYIVGVLIDLCYAIVSDFIFIQSLKRSKRFFANDKKMSWNEISVLLNMISILIIQLLAIIFLFTKVDAEWMFHNICIALRFRLFIQIIHFTDSVLAGPASSANSGKKGGAMSPMVGRTRAQSVTGTRLSTSGSASGTDHV